MGEGVNEGRELTSDKAVDGEETLEVGGTREAVISFLGRSQGGEQNGTHSSQEHDRD